PPARAADLQAADIQAAGQGDARGRPLAPPPPQPRRRRGRRDGGGGPVGRGGAARGGGGRWRGRPRRARAGEALRARAGGRGRGPRGGVRARAARLRRRGGAQRRGPARRGRGRLARPGHAAAGEPLRGRRGACHGRGDEPRGGRGRGLHTAHQRRLSPRVGPAPRAGRPGRASLGAEAGVARASASPRRAGRRVPRRAELGGLPPCSPLHLLIAHPYDPGRL
ncbi:unnamed protein product, partial [Prorocentrum cordatum]